MRPARADRSGRGGSFFSMREKQQRQHGEKRRHAERAQQEGAGAVLKKSGKDRLQRRAKAFSRPSRRDLFLQGRRCCRLRNRLRRGFSTFTQNLRKQKVICEAGRKIGSRGHALATFGRAPARRGRPEFMQSTRFSAAAAGPAPHWRHQSAWRPASLIRGWHLGEHALQQVIFRARRWRRARKEIDRLAVFKSVVSDALNLLGLVEIDGEHVLIRDVCGMKATERSVRWLT